MTQSIYDYCKSIFYVYDISNKYSRLEINKDYLFIILLIF